MIVADDTEISIGYGSGDLGYLIHLHGLLYGREYGYGVDFEMYVAVGFAEFHKRYDPAADRIWICRHAGEIVGSLVMMHREEGAAQLRYLILRPEYRGLGIGGKLIDLYMARLYECGYRSSYLWTTDELTAAAVLYKRVGFRLTEEKASTAFGKPLHEQRYDLILP